MRKYRRGFKGYYHLTPAVVSDGVYVGSWVVWTQLKNKTIINMLFNPFTGNVDRRLIRKGSYLNFEVK